MFTVETEADLIQKAKQSDGAALALLLMRHERELVAVIERSLPVFLRSRVSVDDIRQITWEEAFRSIGKFEYRGERSFFAWLRTIADFRVKDALRADDHAKPLFSDASTSSPGPAEPVDPQRSPSHNVARGEAISRMQQLMQSLPQDYRRVLELRYIRGLSLAEAAEQMQRGRGAVAMLTLRALERMHAAMGSTSAYLTHKE